MYGEIYALENALQSMRHTNHTFPTVTHLFVPDQQYATRVLRWISKPTVNVLHEYVCLIRVEGIDRLLHLRRPEASQHVQDNVEVSLLWINAISEQERYHFS